MLESIHWTTGEEMLFTADRKYKLTLPPDFPLLIKFYLFTSAYPIIPNYHDFYEIGYYYSGKGKYFISDKTFNIRAGSVLFIQANQMHYVEADRDDPLRSASIYFMPELLFHPGSNPYDSNYLLPFHSRDKRGNPHVREADLDFSLWELILDMHRELQSKENFYQLALKNRLCEALLRMLKQVKNPAASAGDQAAPTRKIRRLQKVFETIQADYEKPLPLEQLAGAACMSPSYFCRYFKRVTGFSPTHYVLRYRIDKSKELLAQTDLSITEIAFQVGFNSQSYFDRIFQRFTGLSPHHFRRMYSVKGPV